MLTTLKSRFFCEYKCFINSNPLNMSYLTLLPGDSYTYTSSNAQFSTSWFDLVAHLILNLHGTLGIRYGRTVYDHIPIYLGIALPWVVALRLKLIGVKLTTFYAVHPWEDQRTGQMLSWNLVSGHSSPNLKVGFKTFMFNES